MPAGASGSSQMSASEVALAGTSLQRMGGDTSRPSHVYCFGIGLPGSKAGLDSMKAMAPPGWIAHSQSAAAARRRAFPVT